MMLQDLPVSTHPTDASSHCLGSKVVVLLLERIAAVCNAHLVRIAREI